MRRRLDEVSGRREIEPRAGGALLEQRRRNRAPPHPREPRPRRGEDRRWAHSARPVARARSAPSATPPADSIGEPSADSIASRVMAPGRSNRGRPADSPTIVEFEAIAAWAAVEDPVDPAVEIGEHMSGGGRAYPARPVGGRRGERDARRLDQRARRLVRRRAQRHAVETGAREQADPAGRRRGQDEGKRSGPERARESSRLRG